MEMSARVLIFLAFLSSEWTRQSQGRQSDGEKRGQTGHGSMSIQPDNSSAINPCGFAFTARTLWSIPVGGPGSPFVAPPLLTPLLPPVSSSSSAPSDNYLVVSAAFHGEIGVYSASDGTPLPGSRYPIHLSSSTIFASPLLHDVDADGSLDVVVTTAEGFIYAFDLFDGTQISDIHAIRPLGLIDRKWLEETASSTEKIRLFPDLKLKRVKSEVENDRKSTSLMVRVLASAVITDLNGDGRVEEMIVPVTYSDEDYLLTSLMILNATSGFSILKRIPLELSRADSEFPAHLLHAPTVVDLDSRSGDVEVLVASTSGRVFAFDSKLANLRVGFPLEVDSVVAPVVVHDLTANGRLELLIADRSGVIHCFDTKGVLKWQTSLANEIETASPSSSSSYSIVGIPRIFDFDSTFDSYSDHIGVTSADGILFILSGTSGAVVARHDLSSSSSRSPLASGLLVTRIVTKPNDGPPDLISLSLDGHLHVLTTRVTTTTITSEDSGAGEGQAKTTRSHTRVTCDERIELGESSLTALLSADLLTSAPGQEILVSTQDGVLMALSLSPTAPDGRQVAPRDAALGGGGGAAGVSGQDGAADVQFIHVNDVSLGRFGGKFVEEASIPAWESEVPGGNVFGFREPAPAIVIKDWTKSRQHVTGEVFSVSFDVGEAATEGKDDLLRIKVYLGSLFLAQKSVTRPGFHVIRVLAPDEPMSGHLIVRMTNRHGQIFHDSYPISINEALLHDLQWILLAPFVATVVTYLVVHGYPEDGILPTTIFKGK